MYLPSSFPTSPRHVRHRTRSSFDDTPCLESSRRGNEPYLFTCGQMRHSPLILDTSWFRRTDSPARSPHPTAWFPVQIREHAVRGRAGGLSNSPRRSAGCHHPLATLVAPIHIRNTSGRSGIPSGGQPAHPQRCPVFDRRCIPSFFNAEGLILMHDALTRIERHLIISCD